MIFSINNINN